MYAARPAVVYAVPPRRGLTNVPLLGLCCVIFILFLIAATIVLALIPLYLPTKNVSLNDFTPTYYFLLTPNGTLGDDGPIDESTRILIANAISEKLGFPQGSLELDNATLATVQPRRKRQGLSLTRIHRQSSREQFGVCNGRFRRSKCRRFKDCKPAIFSFDITIIIFINGIRITITIHIDIYFNPFPLPPTRRTSTTTVSAISITTMQSTTIPVTGSLMG